jgi:hypothetical protein
VDLGIPFIEIAESNTILLCNRYTIVRARNWIAELDESQQWGISQEPINYDALPVCSEAQVTAGASLATQLMIWCY